MHTDWQMDGWTDRQTDIHDRANKSLFAILRMSQKVHTEQKCEHFFVLCF